MYVKSIRIYILKKEIYTMILEVKASGSSSRLKNFNCPFKTN